MPEPLRAELQPLFQCDFSAVRIHDTAASHAAAHRLDARAFTLGRDIHFGAGEYRPAETAGRRLLAHELAHTVQQSGTGGGVQREAVGGAGTDALEQEADRAAEAVVAGRPAQVMRVVGSALQRQPKGTVAPQKIVDPVEPSEKQKKMIETARRAAAGRAQNAMFKVRGLHPHTGAMDSAQARDLARLKFNWPNPDMDQVDEVVSAMVARLQSVKVMVAGNSDPECGSRAGYVRGHKPPIVLCPAFFRDPAAAEERVRTMIHEAAHLAKIGNADAAESYYPIFDCSSRGEFESADAWMHYVMCLSGQKEDKNEIKASRAKSRSTKKAGIK